jgi:hypothetical protein
VSPWKAASYAISTRLSFLTIRDIWLHRGPKALYIPPPTKIPADLPNAVKEALLLLRIIWGKKSLFIGEAEQASTDRAT